MISRRSITLNVKKTSLECKRIYVLEWPGNLPNMNPIENLWNIIKKVIGHQIPCKREVMWDRVCDAWYSVAPNVQEDLTIPCLGELQIFIKQKEMQRITEFMMWA